MAPWWFFYIQLAWTVWRQHKYFKNALKSFHRACQININNQQERCLDWDNWKQICYVTALVFEEKCTAKLEARRENRNFKEVQRNFSSLSLLFFVQQKFIHLAFSYVFLPE